MGKIKIGLIRRFVDFALPHPGRAVPEDTPLIEPSPNSPEGMAVPEVIAVHGDLRGHMLKVLSASPHLLPHLLRALYYARKSSRSIKRLPPDARRKADESFFEELEAYARELGCSAVGYTEVPSEYIFKNRALLFRNAIVLIMGMDREKIEQAPGLAAGMEVWRTYAELSRAVYKVSEFMRERGYNAQPDPPIGGSTNFPLLAQKAGLGYIGKHGLLISEGNGPSQRIAAIYTDIENLPFTDPGIEKYSWIPQFCEICNRCVFTCPAGAIYKETEVSSDGRERHIDYTRCAKVFSRTLGCSLCIKECAFFKGDFWRIKQALVKHKNRKMPR